MNQSERRLSLIKSLIAEDARLSGCEIPGDPKGQAALLRALFNVREPREIGEGFLEVQDAYLREETRKKGITRASDLQPLETKNGTDLCLWQGDITTLECDAIVNAANSGMTGCYVPNHRCIDNCIHTFAGLQLRNECARLMRRQGAAEPTGSAKLTRAYNLPCKFVLHTVGPIIRQAKPTNSECEELASCYKACLKLAAETGLESVAFCCISTGEFRFPHEEAAQIAVTTVKAFTQSKTSVTKVIFNVFKDEDKRIYGRLLGAN